MPETPDLEARVSALEKKVDVIAKDAAAARVLAGAADRDVSEMQTELRGHTQVLNALRETQLEHGHRLGRVEGRLDRVEGRLDLVEHKVDVGFARMDENFAKVDENFAKVDENFAKVDENFGKVEQQFAKVGVGMAEMATLLNRALGEGNDN